MNGSYIVQTRTHYLTLELVQPLLGELSSFFHAYLSVMSAKRWRNNLAFYLPSLSAAVANESWRDKQPAAPPSDTHKHTLYLHMSRLSGQLDMWCGALMTISFSLGRIGIKASSEHENGASCQHTQHLLLFFLLLFPVNKAVNAHFPCLQRASSRLSGDNVALRGITTLARCFGANNL
jgi:hypothetical protein